MRLGPWEIAAILAVAVLIFGPSKLPKLGQSLAEFFKNFKKGVREVEKEGEEIKKNLTP
ncbi:MAG: twin-arginine translocase TatA/TatE family subunit [Deltaproteobacteria bacterium]|nr:twin-arginine translocase TatA/TatE family subunit [Deltaproteobacteria bacterium]